jgi:hypothetical protein
MKGIHLVVIVALISFLNAYNTHWSLPLRNQMIASNIFVNTKPIVGGDNTGTVHLIMQSGNMNPSNDIKMGGGTATVTNCISNNSISLLQRLMKAKKK